MFVSIGEAAVLIGVAVSTLRGWEKEGNFHPVFRTVGKHRRYSVEEIQKTFLTHLEQKTWTNICYSRVSSHDQKEDLQLVADVIELMTVFCSKIYGKRSHSNRKKAA